jgi:hypothetical protein
VGRLRKLLRGCPVCRWHPCRATSQKQFLGRCGMVWRRGHRRARSVGFGDRANIAKLQELLRSRGAPETTSGLLWPGAGPSAAKGYPLS